MYHPRLEYIITHNQRSLPLMLGGFKTPHVFWRVVVAIADLAENYRPCWATVRYLAKAARCSAETFVKYRDLAVKLGFFTVEYRPGIGRDHLSNLCVPQRSSYWAVFKRRTDSEFRTHVSELKTDTVKSTESVSKPVASACDGAAETLEPEPHRLVDQPPTPEHTESHELESWELAKFLAMVAAVFGWNLKPREGRSLIYTARRRGLTSRFKPEAVLHAIRNDATFRDGFEQFRSDQVRSPGALLHARIQDLPEEQFAAVAICLPSSTAPIEPPAAAPVAIVPPGAYRCEICSDTGRISFTRNGYDYARDCECRKKKLAKVPPKPDKPREMKWLESASGVFAQLGEQLAQIPYTSQETAYLADISYSAGFTSCDFGAEFIPNEGTGLSPSQVPPPAPAAPGLSPTSVPMGEFTHWSAPMGEAVTPSPSTTCGVSHAPTPMGETLEPAGDPAAPSLSPTEVPMGEFTHWYERLSETPDGSQGEPPRQERMGETAGRVGETPRSVLLERTGETAFHPWLERTGETSLTPRGEIAERTRPAARDGSILANWGNFEKKPGSNPAAEPDQPLAAKLTGQTSVHGAAETPQDRTDQTSGARHPCRRAARPVCKPAAPPIEDG